MQTTQDNYVGQMPFSTFQSIATNARVKGHKHWIGDIPVHEELLNFYKAFKNKRYNIVPCVDVKSQASFIKQPDDELVGINVYNALGITFPDTTDFRSGEIRIDTVDSEIVYCVKSNDIQNEKFSTHSDGYHIRQSKDMTKAVKLAMKFLTPLDFDDVNNKCKNNLQSGINNLREPAREKLYQNMSIDRTAIAQEVSHMIACGYVPSTPAFKNALDTWVSEGAELKRMQDYKPRACFVWVKPNSLLYKFTEDREATECTSMDDVPELIRNKLAVLQIASNGDAIADVGVRVSAITYWVFA
jgi:hypothetical protein